jgi:hypothetical protein
VLVTQNSFDLPPATEGVIKSLVERVDATPEPSRISEGYLHVSSLLNFCPRKWRLVTLDKVNLTNSPSSADRLVWAIGRAVEAHIRGAFIRAVEHHGVIGHWRCPCGETVHEGKHPQKLCNCCKHPTNIYGEATVFDHDLRISGNPDLLWETENGLLVVEIKSMNKRQFDELDRPVENHVFQAACYHYLLKKNGKQMHDSVAVVYGCKDYSFSGSPYKEFHVLAESRYPIIEGVLDQVRLLRKAEMDGELPDRLAACPNCHSPIAKKCELVYNCFSR